jgi:hypothetical protein
MKTLFVMSSCFGIAVALLFTAAVRSRPVMMSCCFEFWFVSMPQKLPVLRRNRMHSAVSKLKVFALVLSMLSLMGLSSGLAYGQAEAGTINGTVKDASGAVIVGATVTVRNLETSAERTVQTGNSGQYSIPGMNPGNYRLAVASPNFQSFQSNVQVTVGGTSTVNVQLSVGQSTVTVEVSGEAGLLVNTQTQEVSELINRDQVEQLPSLTRNPYDFVSVAGNVSAGDRTSSGGDQNTTGRGVGFNINGQRSSGTEILLDGVENIDLFKATYAQQIPVDAVQEFRVVTNNFDSQYGRASGGVVNLTTRVGTNSFHGSAWEFNRLSAYTANTYDNDAHNNPKGSYTRNQFGYSVGGPIVKSKLFFFQTTEFTRVRSSASLSAYVPTPELLALVPANVQDYFSKYGSTKFNFASTLTAGDVAAAVGTTGAFNTIPASTPAVGLVNFTAPADAGGDVPQNTHRLVGRLDFNASDRNQMFFRYGLENLDQFLGSQFASPFSQYNVGEADYNNSGLFSFNHMFTSTFLSSTKLSFSRIISKQSYDPAVQNVPELLISSGSAIHGTPVQLPGLWAQFAGAGGEPYGGPQNVAQVAPDISWIKGQHSIRFGGLFDYQQMNRAYGAYAQGLEELGTSSHQGWDNIVNGNLALFQAAIDPQGKLPCVRNSDGSLIKIPACQLTLPATSPSFARSYRYKDWAVYLQDSWRVNPRLTLNYGTRYEHYGVQHNNVPSLDSNFYFGSGSNLYQKIRNGQVSLTQASSVGGFWAPDWGTIAPRVGFAYDIFGDAKTSLRGGFGVSYERNFGNVTFNAIQNVPNYASVQFTPAAQGGTPIPVTSNNFGPFGGSSGTVYLSPTSLRHMAQNINTAQTQFYSLGLERELGRGTVLALEYSGAHGVHLYDIAAYNDLGGGQVYLQDAFDGTHYTRANQQYGGINTRGSGGTSRYNGLNVRFQSTDLRHSGVSVVANYTYSHSMDDLSSTFSDSTGGASNGIGNLGYLDPRNPKLDWGSSDFDIRNRISLSMIWETPWYRSGKGLRRQALGGYTIVPVFTARTGVPFSIFDTTNSVNAGAGYGIPRYVAAGTVSNFHTGSPVAIGPNNFQVLSLPPGNSFSNVALGGISDFGPYPSDMTLRNAFRGPSAWNFDLALTKSFAVTERVRVEFRAEGFDLFNHHNLYINALNLDNANFGGGRVIVNALKGGLGTNAIGGNHDERRFGQFALRVSF